MCPYYKRNYLYTSDSKPLISLIGNSKIIGRTRLSSNYILLKALSEKKSDLSNTPTLDDTVGDHKRQVFELSLTPSTEQ